MVLVLEKTSDITDKKIDILKKNLKENTIILIHSNTCGHCISFKPEWDKFKKLKFHYDTNKKLNIIQIESEALIELNKNHKNIYKKIVPSNGLVYFPMIIILNNNDSKTKKYLYESERKVSSIKKFINEKFKKSYIDLDKLNSSFNELITKIIYKQR